MPVKPANRSSYKIRRRSERGYILITLIFMIALLIIAVAITAPSIAFQTKRDREEEMIHRGVQYSRAIRKFVKKVGRYPTRLEELDNTNQIRFLRRHYKDPITGQDFKLLHQGEVQLAFGGGIAGALPPGGANTLAGAQGVQQQAAAQIAQGLAAGQATQNSGNIFGNTANSGNLFGNSDTENGQAPADGSTGTNTDNGSGVGGTTGQPGQSGQNPAGSGGGAGTVSVQNGPPKVFGGGPIVGVASTSKAKTIRIFNKKNHYNEWQFIYDPSTDRGGLLNTPAQPALQGASTLQQPNGQQSNNPQNNSGSIFGTQGNGTQNNGPSNPPNGTPPQVPGQLPEQ